jgi:5-methylcytosine-specific restriction endonuclease McrA
MFDKSLWPDDELDIFRIFHFWCAVCKQDAVCLHEIVPKSLAPITWQEPMNRIPVCASCHDKIHAAGTVLSRDKLTRIRREY